MKNWTDLITKKETAGTRRIYHVGERFQIEITTCEHDRKNKHDMMNIWKKEGYIENFLATHLNVSTYYTDIGGRCWGYYNITEKLSEDGRRNVIDFDYILEATEENEMYLVGQCIRMMEVDIRPLTA